MRKFICLLVVVVVLVCCAVPAFASGNSDGVGTVVYTPLQFDEFYSDMSGGPYEWLGNYYRQSQTSEDFSLCSGWLHGSISVGSNGNMSYEFFTSGNNFTLVANNEYMRLGAAQDIYFGCLNARFKKVRFYGSYVAMTRGADGQVVLQRYNFDHTYQMGSNVRYSVPIGQWLDASLEEKYGYDPNGMFFEKLSIDFAIEPDDVDTPHFWYDCDRQSGSSVVYDFRSWVNLQLREFDTDPKPPEVHEPIKFDIGTFLGDSVSSFMTTPIFNDFTFGHLLGIVLTLGVLFFALKLLV